MTDDLPSTGQRRRRGLGRMSDPVLRRAVELRAMTVVRQHFEGSGWSLKDTSARHPWDYEATRDGDLLRIEVKGTTSLGTHVQVTAGEVVSASTHEPSALAVVGDVVLDTSGTEPQATGGRLHLVHPWKPDKADLRPLAYEYRVPSADGH